MNSAQKALSPVAILWESNTSGGRGVGIVFDGGTVEGWDRINLNRTGSEGGMYQSGCRALEVTSTVTVRAAGQHTASTSIRMDAQAVGLPWLHARRGRPLS